MSTFGRRYFLVLPAVLVLLAGLGNYHYLTLLDGELRYLLGSVFSLLALRLFNLPTALFVAVFASVVTLWVWQHPLGLVIYPLEILFIFAWCRRYESSLLIAAMLFWLIVGAPLITVLLLSTGFVSPPELVMIVAMKHAVNGILNALLAELLYTLLRFYRPSRLALKLQRLRITDVVFFALLVSMMIPVTAILLNFSHQVSSVYDIATWLSFLILMIIANLLLAKAISGWMSNHLKRLALVGSAQQRLSKYELEEFNVLGKALGEVSDGLEKRAREQHVHTQTILDNILDGIITIDAHGTVLSFNRSAERIFGYREDAVIGHNVSMLMPEPYHSEHDVYLQNYVNTGKRQIIGKGREVSGRHLNGKVFPVDLMVTEISRNDSPVFIGTVRDISERKKVDQLKNEFVATVSHELRTPLTAICGALGLIPAAQPDNLKAEVLKLLELAQNNCTRLGRLIDDLLDIESLVTGRLALHIQRESLAELVRQVVDDNRVSATKAQVEIILRQLDDAWADVDEKRFMQIVTNLLSNAIKYSPENSTVAVELALQGDRARVSVHDSGPGIPGEFHSRIFDRFAQADSSDARSRGGAGLGLAISRELVQRMQGVIGFDSIEGRGTTFYIEFPARQIMDL